MKIPPYIHAVAYTVAVIAFLILGVTMSTYFLVGAALFGLLALWFWYKVKNGGAQQDETTSKPVVNTSNTSEQKSN